ncbi:MAG: DNA-processing protein DprA [Enterococcus aquimarinus]|uniref:DNA-processing protein DprA n=1 Tax=Enterococcus aquimarinus TaxID=328396 RepID=A0A9E3ZR97_9ENTE|nr:DNA-processing protein DprA [Enterococcus aquimarinus]
MDEVEELLYKLIYCEGLGIVGKWRLLHFAMKFEYTDFNIDEVIKITNTSGNKGALKESWQRLTTEWLQEKRNRQKSVSFFSERYPESLKNIAQPPLALFYEGNIDFLEYPSIAMVGARLATPYASQVLYQLIPKLVLENLVIVSGLAKGVDRLSHELAILAGGKTIGVIGCGLDRCYPKEVSDLFQEMKQKQLVLSEYPLGTPIKKHHFPMRNRIIAGLTQGTCVIEAKERSGSLITAQLALDNGKEVFAIPGEILSGQSSGCHRLIQDGAKCVYRMEDILEELPQYRLDFLKP